MVFLIDALEIDDNVLDKIESKHGVSYEEVKEACFGENVHVRRSRGGLYKLFSQSNARRYIIVVLMHHGGGIWKIVTAREMTLNERSLYKRATGGH
jgi:uncharacterized DUF497 family protein